MSRSLLIRFLPLAAAVVALAGGSAVARGFNHPVETAIEVEAHAVGQPAAAPGQRVPG